MVESLSQCTACQVADCEVATLLRSILPVMFHLTSHNYFSGTEQILLNVTQSFKIKYQCPESVELLLYVS